LSEGAPTTFVPARHPWGCAFTLAQFKPNPDICPKQKTNNQMIELKKSDLQGVLVTIDGRRVSDGVSVGLLSLPLTLGTKRVLSKIVKQASVAYEEFRADVKALQDMRDGIDKANEQGQALSADQKAFDFSLQMAELTNETVKLSADKVNMSFLENVSTDLVFDWDLIEKFSQ
jgi:hypothetical protein